MTKKFKGIIFDMDGLLFDTENLYCEANINMAPKYGIVGYDKEYYMRYIGISDEELHQAYYQDFDYLTKEQIDGFIEACYKEVREMFLAGKAELKPGVRELLTFLVSQDIPMVVASSNLREFITILLDKAEIGHYFKSIISFEDVKKAKPDPEIVEIAVAKLGLLNSECLMLEDSYNGVLAAHSAGVPVIMVPDLLEPTTEIADKLFAEYDSLFEVLESLR